MASVTYKIGGKYDGKGIKSAKKDLSDLANVVKGLAVVKIAQELNKVAQATKGVFTAQNQALTQFNTAVAKSGLELKKLNDIKKSVSTGNFIDDESINKVMTYGMQMGLNAEQIEKVTKASINMASAGVKPLDKAMKELTTTALKNEDALDGIVAQYDGFADAMSRTFSGRDTQWKNSISDLQTSIGAIPKSLEFLAQGKLLEPLNKITDWFVTNRNSIINFFLNLPQIFSVIGKSFTNMFKRTFENLPEWFSNIGVYFVQIFKDGFNTVFNVAKESFNGMMTLLDFAIGNPFRSSKNFINTMLNNLIEGLNSLADKLPDWTKTLFGIEEGNAIKFRFDTGQNGDNKTWEETAKKIEKSMSNVVKAYSDGAKKTKEDWLKVLDATTKFYAEDIDALKTQLSAILGKDLPEELQMALDGLTVTPGIGAVVDEDSTTESKKKSGISKLGQSALSGVGEIGSFVQSIISDGIWGAIAELLSKILKKVEEVSPLFQFFENIFTELIDILINPDSGLIKSIEKAIKPFMDGFNAVKDIFSGILDVVASIIDAFTPILQGLTMILNKIAPVIVSILQVITLLFKVIGQIGEMLNPILQVVLEVLTPVLEIINVVIKAIYKIIATIVNVVVDIYNAIKPFWAGSLNHVSTDVNNSSVFSGYAGYNLPSNYATESAAASSHNATYNTARDIYLNVIFDHSFVNSDGREVALMIRDEIRSAERLGY